MASSETLKARKAKLIKRKERLETTLRKVQAKLNVIDDLLEAK